MSWSHKITLLYSGFVILILSMVFISSRNKEDLVATDYYAQELRYQDQIDAANNEKSLTESIGHSILPGGVALTLPAALDTPDLEGKIHLYCAADASSDAKFDMQFRAGRQEIRGIKAGAYKLKLNWTANGRNYYKESVITIK